jgi:hypothetical protein
MFVFGCMCQGGTRIEPARAANSRSADNAPRAPTFIVRTSLNKSTSTPLNYKMYEHYNGLDHISNHNNKILRSSQQLYAIDLLASSVARTLRFFEHLFASLGSLDESR